MIRGRARAAELNSDLAESVVLALLRNVVGTGIKPQCKIKTRAGKLNERLNKKIEEAWADATCSAVPNTGIQSPLNRSVDAASYPRSSELRKYALRAARSGLKYAITLSSMFIAVGKY